MPDIEAGLLEYRQAKIERPTLTFDDGLTLRRGEREIQVRFLGRANTEGDAVVWLPQERILFSGDIVVSPLPYGFGSYPEEWLETLDKLVALDFGTLVPGHGDVQRDASYLRALQALIRKVQADVGAAAAQGATLEQARERLDLGPLAGQFTGGDARRQALFEAWFMQPFSSSAYKEAKGQPIVPGARSGYRGPTMVIERGRVGQRVGELAEHARAAEIHVPNHLVAAGLVAPGDVGRADRRRARSPRHRCSRRWPRPSSCNCRRWGAR